MQFVIDVDVLCHGTNGNGEEFPHQTMGLVKTELAKLIKTTDQYKNTSGVPATIRQGVIGFDICAINVPSYSIIGAFLVPFQSDWLGCSKNPLALDEAADLLFEKLRKMVAEKNQ